MRGGSGAPSPCLLDHAIHTAPSPVPPSPPFFFLLGCTKPLPLRRLPAPFHVPAARHHCRAYSGLLGVSSSCTYHFGPIRRPDLSNRQCKPRRIVRSGVRPSQFSGAAVIGRPTGSENHCAMVSCSAPEIHSAWLIGTCVVYVSGGRKELPRLPH